MTRNEWILRSALNYKSFSTVADSVSVGYFKDVVLPAIIEAADILNEYFEEEKITE